MAQAGLHGMAGLVVRRWMPGRPWLMPGIVLGNMAPDLDNIAVAVATLIGGSTEGLHRTFTHSVFTALGMVLLGYLVARLMKRPRWGNLGLGLGMGITMHFLFDLLLWFNGVEILWPLSSWITLWGKVQPPEWWSQLMMPAEFLAFAAYFWALRTMARESQTDLSYQGKLRLWMGLQAALFIIFTLLVYGMDTRFMTIYGAIYLLSLFLALGVTIRMRATLEVSVQPVVQATAGRLG